MPSFATKEGSNERKFDNSMHLKETERLIEVEEEEKVSNNHVVGCDGKASKMSDPLFSALFSENMEPVAGGGFKMTKKTSTIEKQFINSD